MDASVSDAPGDFEGNYTYSDVDLCPLDARNDATTTLRAATQA